MIERFANRHQTDNLGIAGKLPAAFSQVDGGHDFQVLSIHHTLEKCYRKMRPEEKTANCFLCIEISEIQVGKGMGEDEVLAQQAVGKWIARCRLAAYMERTGTVNFSRMHVTKGIIMHKMIIKKNIIDE